MFVLITQKKGMIKAEKIFYRKITIRISTILIDTYSTVFDLFFVRLKVYKFYKMFLFSWNIKYLD